MAATIKGYLVTYGSGGNYTEQRFPACRRPHHANTARIQPLTA